MEDQPRNSPPVKMCFWADVNKKLSANWSQAIVIDSSFPLPWNQGDRYYFVCGVILTSPQRDLLLFADGKAGLQG